VDQAFIGLDSLIAALKALRHPGSSFSNDKTAEFDCTYG
jgi:hypothetical protein